MSKWTQVYFRSTFTARKLLILYLFFKEGEEGGGGGWGGRMLLRYLYGEVSLVLMLSDSNSDCPTLKDFPTPAINHKDCSTMFFLQTPSLPPQLEIVKNIEL